MQKQGARLTQGSKIIIVGGGPSGAFFAIHLLRQAAEAGLHLEATIIDKRMEQPSNTLLTKFRGCNMCAGIISPRLEKELKNCNIRLPETVLCKSFTHIWIHGLWKNFPLKIPHGTHMLSVFRGNLPSQRDPNIQGFDAFILEKAIEGGAQFLSGEAIDIRYNTQNKPCLTFMQDSHTSVMLDADFILISTGINTGGAGRENAVFRSFEKINPEFKPPETRQALIFELKPGAQYLKKAMDREVYIIVAGSDTLDIDHAALIPKKDCLTVALIGKSIDTADLHEDKLKLIHAFMALPGVKNILPGIT